MKHVKNLNDKKKSAEPLNKIHKYVHHYLDTFLFTIYFNISSPFLSPCFQWHDGFVETLFDVKVALIYVNLWVYVLLYVCIQSLARLVLFFFFPSSFNHSQQCLLLLSRSRELSRKMKAKIRFIQGLLFIDINLLCFEFKLDRNETNILERLYVCVKCWTFINSHNFLERKFRWWSPYALTIIEETNYEMHLKTPNKNSLSPPNPISSSNKIDYLCKYGFHHSKFIARCVINEQKTCCSL